MFEQTSKFKLSELGEKNFTFQYCKDKLQSKKAWGIVLSSVTQVVETSQQQDLQFLFYYTSKYTFFFNKLQSFGISHKPYDKFSYLLCLSNEYNKGAKCSLH